MRIFLVILILLFLEGCGNSIVIPTPTLSFEPILVVNGRGNSPLILTINKEIIARFVDVNNATVTHNNRKFVVKDQEDFFLNAGRNDINVKSDSSWKLFFAAKDGSTDFSLDFETIK